MFVISESGALNRKIMCKWFKGVKRAFFAYNFVVGLARNPWKSAKCEVPYAMWSEVSGAKYGEAVGDVE